jgi:hypothetical protein
VAEALGASGQDKMVERVPPGEEIGGEGTARRKFGG